MKELTGEAWITSRAKRRQDIALTLAMAPIALPSLAVAASAILLVDRMSPLFVHQRDGSKHVPFSIFKLRTMPPDTALAPGGRHNDDRRTELGKFLAKIRADEAPQFWNILRGDMSVVGYRPLIVGETETAKHNKWLSIDQYDDLMRMRYIGKPGLLHLMGVQNPHMEFATMRESWQARYETEREYFANASSHYDMQMMLDSAKVALHLLGQKAAPLPNDA